MVFGERKGARVVVRSDRSVGLEGFGFDLETAGN